MIGLIIAIFLGIFGLIEQVNGMAVEECQNIILVGVIFAVLAGHKLR